MMNRKLKAFVRNDLKMRKGKMAAQSSHAGMKLFFEIMEKAPNKMILRAAQHKEFKQFLANPDIEIVMVQDEAELNSILDKSLPHSVIVDNGRTEFHGVPTATCSAQGIFSECAINELNVPQTYGTEIKAKQVFVFNKDFPLSKVLACEQAVVACLKVLYAQMEPLDEESEEVYFDLSKKSALNDWILNAFGKIALSTKTLDELKAIEEQVKAAGFSYVHVMKDDNHCLCVAPQYPADIDVITRELSLI